MTSKGTSHFVLQHLWQTDRGLSQYPRTWHWPKNDTSSSTDLLTILLTPLLYEVKEVHLLGSIEIYLFLTDCHSSLPSTPTELHKNVDPSLRSLRRGSACLSPWKEKHRHEQSNLRSCSKIAINELFVFQLQIKTPKYILLEKARKSPSEDGVKSKNA